MTIHQSPPAAPVATSRPALSVLPANSKQNKHNDSHHVTLSRPVPKEGPSNSNDALATNSKPVQNTSTDNSYARHDEIEETTEKETHSDEQLKQHVDEESLFDDLEDKQDKHKTDAGKLSGEPSLTYDQKQKEGKTSVLDSRPDLQGFVLKQNHSKGYHSHHKRNLPPLLVPPPQPPLMPPPQPPLLVHPTTARNGTRSGIPRTNSANQQDTKAMATTSNGGRKLSGTHHHELGSTGLQSPLSEINKMKINIAKRNTIPEHGTVQHATIHKLKHDINDNTRHDDKTPKTDAISGTRRHNKPLRQILLPERPVLSKFTTMDKINKQLNSADLRMGENTSTGTNSNNRFYKQAEESELTNMKLAPDNGSTTGIEFVIYLRNPEYNKTRKDNRAKKNRKFLKQGAETDDALFAISKDVTDQDNFAEPQDQIPANGIKSSINKFEAHKHDFHRKSTVVMKTKRIPLIKKHKYKMIPGFRSERMQSSKEGPQNQPSKQNQFAKTNDAKYGRTKKFTRKPQVNSPKHILKKNQITTKYHGTSRPERHPEPDYYKHIHMTRKPLHLRSSANYDQTKGPTRKTKIHERLSVQPPGHRMFVSREFIRSYSKPQHNNRIRTPSNNAKHNHQDRMRRDEIYKVVPGSLVSKKLKHDKGFAKDNPDVDSFNWQQIKTPQHRFPHKSASTNKWSDIMTPENNPVRKVKLSDDFNPIRTKIDQQHYDRPSEGHQVNIDAQLNYDIAKKEVPLVATVGVDHPSTNLYGSVIDVGTDYEVLNTGDKYKRVVHKNGNGYKIGFENAQKLDREMRNGRMVNPGNERVVSKHMKGIEPEPRDDRARQKYYIKIYPDKNFGSYERNNPYHNRHGNERRPKKVAAKHLNVPIERTVKPFNEKHPMKLFRTESRILAGERGPVIGGQRSVSAVITQRGNSGHKRHGHTDLWWWRLVEKAMKQSEDETPPSEAPPQTHHNSKFVYHHKQQSFIRPALEAMDKRRHPVPNHIPTYKDNMQRKNVDDINGMVRSGPDGEGWREFGLTAGEDEEAEGDGEKSWQDKSTEFDRRMESTTAEVKDHQGENQAEQGKCRNSKHITYISLTEPERMSNSQRPRQVEMGIYKTWNSCKLTVCSNAFRHCTLTSINASVGIVRYTVSFRSAG